MSPENSVWRGGTIYVTRARVDTVGLGRGRSGLGPGSGASGRWDRSVNGLDHMNTMGLRVDQQGAWRGAGHGIVIHGHWVRNIGLGRRRHLSVK